MPIESSIAFWRSKKCGRGSPENATGLELFKPLTKRHGIFLPL
jgi:hypothetical protein